MTLDHILGAIDAEIAQLQQARALLAGTNARYDKRTTTAAVPKQKRRKRMSAEGRKRIADAQRKRWAAQKREVSKP